MPAVSKALARPHVADPLLANPSLAEAVRQGWITPAVVVSDEPPPRLPVAPLKELLAQLDDDRAER